MREINATEAWIKLPERQSDLRKIAEQFSKDRNGAIKYDIEVVTEPFEEHELCNSFRNDTCKFHASRCDFKHILCSRSKNCNNKRCPYGHKSNHPKYPRAYESE